VRASEKNTSKYTNRSGKRLGTKKRRRKEKNASKAANVVLQIEEDKRLFKKYFVR